jgi:hypothetical protein
VSTSKVGLIYPARRGSRSFCRILRGSTEGHRPRNTHQGFSPLHLLLLISLILTPTTSAATTAPGPAVPAVLVACPVAALTVPTLLPNLNAVAAAGVPTVFAAHAFSVALADVTTLAATLTSTAATVPTRAAFIITTIPSILATLAIPTILAFLATLAVTVVSPILLTAPTTPTAIAAAAATAAAATTTPTLLL